MFLNDNLKIFSGSSNPALAGAVCKYLRLPLGGAKIERFPDGEKALKLEDDVRGRDCFVVQSTCKPVDENLMELLIYLDCLRRASAQRITAVIPYFGYARQDRKEPYHRSGRRQGIDDRPARGAVAGFLRHTGRSSDG